MMRACGASRFLEFFDPSFEARGDVAVGGHTGAVSVEEKALPADSQCDVSATLLDSHLRSVSNQQREQATQR
jgi:hypothetical protein